MKIRSLYVSHMGMTEPLGQSQVLPYLLGLAQRGAEIDILSFERTATRPDAIASLDTRLRAAGMHWHPMRRAENAHGLGRKVWESSSGVAQSLRLALRRRPRIVHARSYLPAAVSDVIASVVPGARLLFDCRGMLGDEYVDAGHWRTDGVNYRLLKAFERRLFRRTDGMVVLTEALRRWLGERSVLGARTEVAVIPCCVDTDRFHPDADARVRTRAALGVGDRLVVVYSGSLGTWYLEPEMSRFVAELKRLRPDTLFLALTRSDASSLQRAMRSAGVADADVRVMPVAPAEMPATLVAGDVGLSFIQSCFSKKGSSPTKVAEYLGAGMPVVVNGDIGDQADLASERDACVVLPAFDDAALAAAARDVLALAQRPYAERAPATFRVAVERFSLAHIGVPRYAALYAALAEQT
jgi:glycosyltransferase involved in cell wall biosynthesis